MAGMRDIRSFFGQPAPKRRRTDATDGEQESAAAAATAAASEEQADDTTASGASSPLTQKSSSAVARKKARAEKGNDTDTGADADADAAVKVDSFVGLQIKKQLRSLMHPSWFEVLEKEFARESFRKLGRSLETEEKRETIYPPPRDVFAALRDFPFTQLKVVILGQDPYHGPKQAHGLSFSVRHGIQPPPSLRNIFKEAMNDVGIPKPTHGCLTCWSRQGVLLLNTVLTVRRAEPQSHKKRGWEQVTDAIISKINSKASNVVFLLWGRPAQEKAVLIDSKRHLVVRSSHPSPLGATKTNAPFLGSKCFSRANSYLIKHGKEPIDWTVQ